MILPPVIFAPFNSSFTAGNAPLISPAKPPTIANGMYSSAFCTVKNPTASPIRIPIPIGSKKKKQRLNCLKRLDTAYKNASYNLKIIATVDPLIPGTITASPIKNPSNALLLHVFLLYLINAFCRSCSISPSFYGYSSAHGENRNNLRSNYTRTRTFCQGESVLFFFHGKTLRSVPLLFCRKIRFRQKTTTKSSFLCFPPRLL